MSPAAADGQTDQSASDTSHWRFLPQIYEIIINLWFTL